MNQNWKATSARNCVGQVFRNLSNEMNLNQGGSKIVSFRLSVVC